METAKIDKFQQQYAVAYTKLERMIESAKNHRPPQRSDLLELQKMFEGVWIDHNACIRFTSSVELKGSVR